MDPQAFAEIHRRLMELTVGYTTTIGGVAVTRWTAHSFEVGTFGRATVNVDVAADQIADAELDERRELLAWEEERATNDAYDRLAGGWIGGGVA